MKCAKVLAVRTVIAMENLSVKIIRGPGRRTQGGVKDMDNALPPMVVISNHVFVYVNGRIMISNGTLCARPHITETTSARKMIIAKAI